MKNIIAMVLAIALNFTPFSVIGMSVSYACDEPVAEQTEVCPVLPHIDYHGEGTGHPNLLPTVCLTQEAIDLMTIPGEGFGFTYYQRYSADGGEDDMEPIITVACITEQWVFPDVRIGFWVDCDGFRWWFETEAITDSGTYTMEFVEKVALTEL
jgi:hypothetical protein